MKNYKRNIKQIVLIIADTVFIVLAIYFSVAIRLGELENTLHASDWICYLLTIVFSIVTFVRIGLYRSIVRYMGHKAFLTIIKAISISSLILAASILFTRNGMPRSIPFIYWGLSLFLFLFHPM